MDTLSFSRVGSASRPRASSAVSYTTLDELAEEVYTDGLLCKIRTFLIMCMQTVHCG